MPLKQTEIGFKVKKSGRLRNKENINLHTRSNSKSFQIALIKHYCKANDLLRIWQEHRSEVVSVRTCIYTFAIHLTWVGSCCLSSVANRAIDVNVCGSSPAHSSSRIAG